MDIGSPMFYLMWGAVVMAQYWILKVYCIPVDKYNFVVGKH